MSASCSIDPDSRRSDIRGVPPRFSGPRLSWARTMMGMPSSLASPLSPAEISAISRSREFWACLDVERMSWR